MITAELFLKVPPEKLGEAVSSFIAYRDTIALAAKAEGAFRKQRARGGLRNVHLFEARATYAPIVASCSYEDLRSLIHDEGEMMALIKKAIKAYPVGQLPTKVESVIEEPPLFAGRPKTSKYRGVSLDKGKKKWRARIEARGKAYDLGYFSSEKMAARAYDRAARKLHGNGAKANFGDGT